MAVLFFVIFCYFLLYFVLFYTAISLIEILTTQLVLLLQYYFYRLVRLHYILNYYYSMIVLLHFRQFDLRAPESCGPNPKNVLVNLNAHLGSHAEAKCVAINALRPEQLAVGANDPYVRLYDRRMLTCKSIRFPTDATSR